MMAHPLSTPLDAAEMCTARGWVVFPCDSPDAGTHCTGTSRACRERRCKAERDPAQRGKHPRCKWGEIIAPVDSVTLRRWFGRDAIPANVAIACGPSGLVIVDEDHAERGGLAGAAASVGQPCPDTFTVSTHAGRRHYYFTAPVDPATGQRWPIGNAPGGLARFGCDVRGGGSASAEAGGYVITAGSTHASGEIYATIGDPHAQAIPLPPWLIGMILAGPPGQPEGVTDRTGSGGEAAGTLRASDGARWDDAPRYGSAEDLRAQFERHCDEVEHEGGAFRHELFLAARDGWRCVALGLLDEPTMLRTLDACVWRVWHAEPDDRDHVIVFGEALPAAQASPWELSGPHRGAVPVDLAGRAFLRSSEAAALTSEDEAGDRTTHGNLSVDPVTEGDRPRESDQERARRKAFERIEAERWAREALDARDRPTLPYITPKGRKDRPRAHYLVPKMLYRNGLAVIFGAPGCGKSFFALDVALSFAAGKPWRGQRITAPDGGRGMVHYVMAEGEDANNLRIDAWLYHHGLTDDDIEDSFRSIPAAVMLTEAGIREYLPYVEADQPDLIVLDTKNLMFAGRESQGEDYGAMLRVLHKLQVAAGGCTIILIDHSGLGDPSRPRGNNAQLGGVDTEIMVTEDHGLRTAEVTKDRSAELGTRWHYRLHQIDEVPRGPFIDPPAVPVEAAPDSGPLRPRLGWPLLRVSDELSAVVRKTDGKGKEAAADVIRLLVGLGRDEEGQSTAQLISMIDKECPREFGKSTIKGAIATLRTAGVIESIGTASAPKYVIVEEWRAHVTEE